MFIVSLVNELEEDDWFVAAAMTLTAVVERIKRKNNWGRKLLRLSCFF